MQLISPYAICIGDTVLDIINIGVTESPGFNKSVVANDYRIEAGGMGYNVAVVLAKLGFQSVLCSWIGAYDFAGQYYERKIQEYSRNSGMSQCTGEIIDLVFRAKDCKTQICNSFVNGSQQRERGYIFCDTATTLDNNDFYSNLDKFLPLLQKAEVIHLSGLGGPSIINIDEIKKLILKLRVNGYNPTITSDTLNTPLLENKMWKTHLQSLAENIDYFIIADHELQRIIESPFTFLNSSSLPKIQQITLVHQEIPKAICRLREILNNTNHSIIVKLGELGVWYSSNVNDAGKHVPSATSTKPFDTTGAGDALCAGLIGGLLYSQKNDLEPDIEQILYYANIIAGETLSDYGVSGPLKTYDDIIKYCRSVNHKNPSYK